MQALPLPLCSSVADVNTDSAVARKCWGLRLRQVCFTTPHVATKAHWSTVHWQQQMLHHTLTVTVKQPSKLPASSLQLYEYGAGRQGTQCNINPHVHSFGTGLQTRLQLLHFALPLLSAVH